MRRGFCHDRAGVRGKLITGCLPGANGYRFVSLVTGEMFARLDDADDGAADAHPWQSSIGSTVWVFMNKCGCH